MEEMVIQESVSQLILGSGLGILINFLRSRKFLSGANKETTNLLTLAASYIGALATTLGVHWTFNGDWLAGQLVITWDAHHILEGSVMFVSSITGQKGWALASKGVERAGAIIDTLGDLRNLASEIAAVGRQLSEDPNKAKLFEDLKARKLAEFEAALNAAVKNT